MIKIERPQKIKLPTSKILEQLITAEINNVAKSFVAEVQKNILDKDITDRGTLLRSIKIIKIDNLEIDVVSTDKKAIYIERGRLPGSFPPIESIREWLTRKGIQDVIKIETIEDLRRARRLLRKNAKKISTQIAFAVAKKIEKEGIEEKPFWRLAIATIEKQQDPKKIKELDKKISELFTVEKE